MSRAYIALGSNLDGPAGHVKQGLADLNAIPDSRVLRESSLYRTCPLGPPGQPAYINAVAELDTNLEPHALLARMHEIEQSHGRSRGAERWGPRTLDLDLLLYDEQRIRDARLTVPHPEMGRRNFVLCPLLEVAPEIRIPGLGRARPLLDELGTDGVERLAENGEEQR